MKGTLTACLAIVLILSPLLGGVVYEIDVTDHEQSPPKVESMESAVEGRNLKMGIRVGEKGPERTMTIVEIAVRWSWLITPTRATS